MAKCETAACDPVVLVRDTTNWGAAIERDFSAPSTVPTAITGFEVSGRLFSHDKCIGVDE